MLEHQCCYLRLASLMSVHSTNTDSWRHPGFTLMCCLNVFIFFLLYLYLSDTFFCTVASGYQTLSFKMCAISVNPALPRFVPSCQTSIRWSFSSKHLPRNHLCFVLLDKSFKCVITLSLCFKPAFSFIRKFCTFL